MARTPIIQWGTPAVANYDGILMRANPALHEQVFMLLRTIVPANASVIDVGAGQGAFSARLRDNGYDVTAVDKDPSDFRASGVKFVTVNFDFPAQMADFRSNHIERYDVAIGMEVIEHVENPWEYVRFLLSLTKPGGTVVITTPNAESIISRVEFLFRGRFSHFDEEDYNFSGHINPLTMYELQLIVSEVGAEIVASKSICRLPWIIISKNLRTVAKSVISSIFRPFVGKQAGGDILLLVLNKNA